MNITPDYALLHSLLDRPIAFHRVFVTISGSVLAGLMLSQAYYWTPRGSSGDGWFYKTQAEWQAETGMTRWEQETARKKLLQVKTVEDVGVWEEERRGVPARLFYRINIAALFECIFGSTIEATIKNVGLPHTGVLDNNNLASDDPTNLSVTTPQSFYTETPTKTTAKDQMRPPRAKKKRSYHPEDYEDL